MTWGILNAMNTTYWSYFLTDIVKISTANVAVLLPMTRLVDIFTALLAGVIIERTCFRWGKYRSWLLLAPPLVMICFILLFCNPPLFLQLKIIYFWVIALTTTLVADLMMNNLFTLVPTVAKNYRDRDVLATKRGQGSIVGKIIFGAVALPIILFFNRGDEAGEMGYLMAVVIFGICMIVSFWALFRFVPQSEETRTAAQSSGRKRVPFLVMCKDFFQAKPFVAVVFADSTRYIAQMTLSGLAVYYFQYVFNNIALLSIMLTSMNITAFVTSFLAEPLTIKIDKYLLYKIGLMVMALSFLGMFLFGYDTWYTFIAFCCLAYLGGGLMSAVSISMYADGALYSRWKTGRAITGFLMSMANIAPKVGQLVASLTVGLSLTSIHYVAGMTLTEAAKYSLHCFITLVPTFFLACGTVTMILLNKLTRKEMHYIQRELFERN